jgi:hypothetical protein
MTPVEIARLAELPQLAYDREREAAAKRLGCRLATLNAAIAPRRHIGGAGKEGSLSAQVSRPAGAAPSGSRPARSLSSSSGRGSQSVTLVTARRNARFF